MVAGYLRPLDRVSTRAIDRTGGTVLHTSRTNPSAMGPEALPERLDRARIDALEVAEGRYDLTPIVLENLEALGVGALVAIGGDDTLGYAARLGSEGFPVVAIPKTMDNDVHGTEYCIGFSTAVTRAKELINRQRTTLGSHERIGVFRIFGRNAGYTAWYAAYVTSARCVIPEAPFDLDRLAALLADDRRLNPSGYAFVIASEGAIWHGGQLGEIGEADAYGHRHKADVGYALAEELKRRTGIETVHSDLTYDLRSGDPGRARPDGGDHVRQRRGRPLADGQLRPHGRGAQRQVQPRAAARGSRRRAAARRGGHVQRGALPPALRGQARIAAAAGAGGPRVTEGTWAPERRLLTVGLIGLVTAAAFEGMAVPTSCPRSSASCGGLDLYGWAFSAFWLTNIIGITLAGSDADRRGPARALAVGTVLFAAGMIVSGVATRHADGHRRARHPGLRAAVRSGSVVYAAIARAYPRVRDAAHDRPRLERLDRARPRRPGAGRAGGRRGRLAMGLPGDRAARAAGGSRPVPAARAARTGSPKRRAGAQRLAARARCRAPGGRLDDAARRARPSASPVLAAGLAVAGGWLALSALRHLLPPGSLRLAAGRPSVVVCRLRHRFAFFGTEAFVPLTVVEVRGGSVTLGGLALSAAAVTWALAVVAPGSRPPARAFAAAW